MHDVYHDYFDLKGITINLNPSRSIQLLPTDSLALDLFFSKCLVWSVHRNLSIQNLNLLDKILSFGTSPAARISAKLAKKVLIISYNLLKMQTESEDISR